MAHEQRQVQYSGHVQGVGFRFTTREIAEEFDVAGYVQNLPDGRVLVVAEGDTAELDAFLTAVGEQMAGYVKRSHVTVQPASGQFTGFEVRR